MYQTQEAWSPTRPSVSDTRGLVYCETKCIRHKRPGLLLDEVYIASQAELMLLSRSKNPTVYSSLTIWPGVKTVLHIFQLMCFYNLIALLTKCKHTILSASWNIGPYNNIKFMKPYHIVTGMKRVLATYA